MREDLWLQVVEEVQVILAMEEQEEAAEAKLEAICMEEEEVAKIVEAQDKMQISLVAARALPDYWDKEGTETTIVAVAEVATMVVEVAPCLQEVEAARATPIPPTP